MPPRPTYHVVPPHEPYGSLPRHDGAEVLGWYVPDIYPHETYEPYSILLSDLGQGEPPFGDIVKTICHEELHHILDTEINHDTSQKLDNLVTVGNFIIDRPENHINDNRPMKPNLTQ